MSVPFHEFSANLSYSDLPADLLAVLRRSFTDTLGVAAVASTTDMAKFAVRGARATFGQGNAGGARVLMDGTLLSPAGAAMAGGFTVDAVDAHDTTSPCKGHVGSAAFPALLAMAEVMAKPLTGQDFAVSLAVCYEISCRAGLAQHATCPDYHTSGSWTAVGVAVAAARMLGGDAEHIRHAVGIGEYHGPRSQMMRCIDHPTMVKDGSGWGAMCGVEAVELAQAGFTGAPAITVTQAPEYWGDLGHRWAILEQYFKPYPVCRWAQAPVEGVLALRKAHGLTAADIDHIEVETFHEAVRLATRRPETPEEAQYSTSFPCALAMVHGEVRPEHLDGPALKDPETLRLSDTLVMRETDFANQPFPNIRYARVTLHLRDGTRQVGRYLTPKWDAENPPSAADLRHKFHALADPVLGAVRASALEIAIDNLEHTDLAPLRAAITAPPSA